MPAFLAEAISVATSLYSVSRSARICSVGCGVRRAWMRSWVSMAERTIGSSFQ